MNTPEDTLNQLNYNDTLMIVKAGTAAVSNIGRTALDILSIGRIGEDIAWLNGKNNLSLTDTCHPLSTVLVTSGAVTAGIERLGWDRAEVDNDLELKRVASMSGNTALVSAWEQATGFVGAYDLPTHNDLDTKESWLHLKNAINLSREKGLLPILNEGDARSSEELETTLRTNGKVFKRFGDNDWLAAHLAVQLEAETLVFLTDKDGVMKDRNDPNSIVSLLALDEIDTFITECVDDLETSNGGMTSKLLAAKFALTHGVKRIHIGDGKEKTPVRRLTENKQGTVIRTRTD